MKQVLEPLAAIPGVRTVLLVTPDGVPITHNSSARSSAKRSSGAHTAHGDHGGRGDRDASRDESEQPADTAEAAEDADALAGLATSWLGEINRAVGPLSWGPPQTIAMRAARGTLLITAAPGALLVIVLEGGMRAEELRLPMEVAVARMQRHLKSLRKTNSPASTVVDQPLGIFPARSTSTEAGAIAIQGTRNGAPEVSGE